MNRLHRTDWLPIGRGDSDEESERGTASTASSLDIHDGWGPDGYESDCSTLRSDGHLQPSSDEDGEFDDDGNFRTIEDDPSMVVQCDFSFTGEPEPQDAYMDLVAFKRRRLEGGAVG